MKCRLIVILLFLAVTVIATDSALAYYSTNLGRFISRDPIGYRGGSRNLYEYVFDSPINFLDPEGLVTIPFPGGAGFWPHGYWPPSPPKPTWPTPTITLPTPNGSNGTQIRIPCSNAMKQFQNTQGARIAVNTFETETLSKLKCRLSDEVSNLPPGSPDCVGTLELIGNADEDDFKLGQGGYNQKLQSSTLSGLISVLDSEIKFCKPCVIALTGCNSGTGVSTQANPSWVQQLANATGCTVIGAGGYVNTTKGGFTSGNISVGEYGNRGGPDPGWHVNDAYLPQADTCYKFLPQPAPSPNRGVAL